MNDLKEQKTDLVFHDDWFSNNIQNIEKYLAHLKDKRCVQGLEIGSWEGRSACWFIENILTGESSKLTCIDTFKGNPENFVKSHHKDVEECFNSNIKAIGAEAKVKLIVQKSSRALKFLHENSFDFIYVDGSHDPKDVLVDLVLSWGLLKNGGILILDDYGLKDPVTGSEPKPAIDAFYFVFKKELIELHLDYQVIWRKI